MNFRLIAISFIILLFASASLGQQGLLRKKPIEKVEIKGNRVFSESKIKSVIFTQENKWYNFLSTKKYSESDVNYDTEQIRKLYGRNGYPFAQAVGSASLYQTDSTKVHVIFTIGEGKKVYLRSLGINGGLSKINVKMSDFLSRIKINEPLNTETIRATVFRIKNLYAENAHPVAVVEYEYRFSEDSSYVDVNFTIHENEYVVNGDIEIVKEDRGKSQEFVLRRELVIDKGEPFDRRKIIESQQRLYSTGLLRFVTLRRTLGLDSISADTSSTNFRLVVNERNALFLNAKIGAGQDENFGAAFNTSLTTGHRNLWGTGRKLIFSYSNSLQLTKGGDETISKIEFNELGSSDFYRELQLLLVKNSLELDYVEPWFLGNRMPLSLSSKYEPRNKNPLTDKYYDRVTGEMILSREINRFTNVSISGRVEFVDIHDIPQDEQYEYRQLGDNSVRRRLSLYGQRDTRDNILVPQKGMFSYASLDYVGDLLGGDYSYLKAEMYWSRFENFDSENVIAVRFNVGVLEELKTEGSSLDDRFTLGGAKSVRGFKENSLGAKWSPVDAIDSTLYGEPKGGKLKLLGNIELRRTLFWRFGGSAFIDAGNVFYNFSHFKAKRIEVAGGLGLQFFTPIGPIRFDHGVRIKKPFDLGAGESHLTILYAF